MKYIISYILVFFISGNILIFNTNNKVYGQLENVHTHSFTTNHSEPNTDKILFVEVSEEEEKRKKVKKLKLINFHTLNINWELKFLLPQVSYQVYTKQLVCKNKIPTFIMNCAYLL